MLFSCLQTCFPTGKRSFPCKLAPRRPSPGWCSSRPRFNLTTIVATPLLTVRVVESLVVSSGLLRVLGDDRSAPVVFRARRRNPGGQFHLMGDADPGLHPVPPRTHCRICRVSGNRRERRRRSGPLSLMRCIRPPNYQVRSRREAFL